MGLLAELEDLVSFTTSFKAQSQCVAGWAVSGDQWHLSLEKDEPLVAALVRVDHQNGARNEGHPVAFGGGVGLARFFFGGGLLFGWDCLKRGWVTA